LITVARHAGPRGSNASNDRVGLSKNELCHVGQAEAKTIHECIVDHVSQPEHVRQVTTRICRGAWVDAQSVIADGKPDL
jgi:hypothetical protein